MIMPLVFGVIVFLIFVGIFQYDKCILQQDVFRMMIRGSQHKFLTNDQVVQEIKEEDARWYYDKYVLCDWNNKIVEVGYDEIRIGQSAVFKATAPLIIDWTGACFWELDADFTGTRIHPVETIRNCRRLERVAERKNENEGMGIHSINES